MELMASNIAACTMPIQRCAVCGGICSTIATAASSQSVMTFAKADGAKLLVNEATAKDFVSDAFAHAKFIAYSDAAKPLLQKAGAEMDGGTIALSSAADAQDFIQACRALRFWEREAKVHAV